MTLLYTLDLVGTATFAASGAWAGIRCKMDLFGVMVLGLVTAASGGALLAVLHYSDLPRTPALLSSTLLVIILRLPAIRFDWSLPGADDRPQRRQELPCIPFDCWESRKPTASAR